MSTDFEITVFTYKEGLLSKVAHDLEIGVQEPQVQQDGDRVEVRVRPASLRVRHALKKGRPAPGTLSAKDIATIEKNTVDDVLGARRHPEVRFEGSWSGDLLSGTLQLHGRSRPIELRFHVDGDRRVARLDLDQRDFGIKPFSAMLGTIKIKPLITLQVSTPLGG